MIKKESISHSNDLIVKRLSKCFQRIRKLKSENKEVGGEYDRDGSNVGKSWRKVHDLFRHGCKIS